jgi:uncharacterized protein
MFGITPFKVLLTLALMAAAWYGFKLIGRMGSGGTVTGAKAAKEEVTAQDMKKCPVCDAFVPAAAPANCGRDDCPYSA